jgi:pre-mRNA-processing factor 17
MDFLHGYGSGDESGGETPAPLFKPVSSAPLVVAVRPSTSSLVLKQGDNKLMLNPKANVVLAQEAGPAHPFRKGGIAGVKKIGTGQLDTAAMEDWAFEQQYQTFQRSGYAVSATDGRVMGDVAAHAANDGAYAHEAKRQKGENNGSTGKGSKRPRLEKVDLGLDDGADGGIWAAEPEKKTAAGLELLAPVDSAWRKKEELEAADEAKKAAGVEAEAEAVKQKGADTDAADRKQGAGDDNGDGDTANNPSSSAPVDGVFIVEPEEEDEKWDAVNERRAGMPVAPRSRVGSAVAPAHSAFHGREERDYQGRAWTHPPGGVRSAAQLGNPRAVLPKKCVKKFVGHTKAVSAIDFFPGTGHLLLSAAMDGKCKVWDVLSDRGVRRTYVGHSHGVRSIDFSSDGSRFVSAGYDRLQRLWDVETGQAVSTFTNRRQSNQIKFYPRDNHIFLVAASDHKVYQWDTRTGQIVQEYNYHLEACNTISFFDDGRKFVTSSDDKKLLIWEYNIPVPLKYISDAMMHSIPAITTSPDGAYFCGQSMDNTVVTFECGAEKVRQLKKKTFTGHKNSGFACQIGFSPDMRFMGSGDGTGQLYFWDFKTGKTVRKFQAHDKACMGFVWHPTRPSMLATGGWDSFVKLWE